MSESGAPIAKVAIVSLAIGRMLLQWGANARTVQNAILRAARGLGCDDAEVYSQHAAVMVSLRRGEESCMEMGKVGEHGIDLRRAEALLELVDEIAAGQWTWDEALQKLEALPTRVSSYPVWIVCLSTGAACAAFGRLLGADALAMGPIFAGACTGQYLRYVMLRRGLNLFFMVTLVSFTSAVIAGACARLIGERQLDLATVASVLLLVPGPAILNAQVDAIDGRPSLAVARGLRVAFIILFMTLGFLLAQQVVHV